METQTRLAGPAIGSETAGRVIDVLLLFGQGPTRRGVTEISRELGLSKTVVHRILQSLVQRDVLVTDPDSRDYRLGAAALALGSRAIREAELRVIGLPFLLRLRDETGETSTLSARVGLERLHLAQVESEQEVRVSVPVGRRVPLYAGSSSLAILAWMPPADQHVVLSRPIPRFTAQTPQDPEKVLSRLTEIRQRGWAETAAERKPDAGAVAAPLLGPDGEVVGAISVAGPINRMDPETRARYAPFVLNAAAELSTALANITDAIPTDDDIAFHES
ncbi:IclR family transcriptional regulator [Actinoplanes derwentensis]|uniref:IclR family transcriptional regulator n=1 Tax=Actinoplanes derwentensis TaxID=113562 RepID=UPI0012FD7CD4|nr:IclR family transcriptional regulator [Actinoplanes derwentensis]